MLGGGRRLFARALLVAASVAIAALLATGCGSGSSDARALLAQAFRHPIRSGDVTLVLQATVNGVAQLQQPVAVKLSGPYQSNPKQIPSFNWTFSIAGGGRAFSGMLVSTGDNAYVGVGGTNYEFGAPRIAAINKRLARAPSSGRSLKAYGIDPQSWVKDARTEGSAQVAGVDTTHVRAGLDVTKALHDFNKTIAYGGGKGIAPASKRLSDQQIASIVAVVKNPVFDVYVAKRDRTIRRLAVSLTFSIPPQDRQRFRGAQGGSLSFSAEIANVGKRQLISAPANARPIKQLLQLFGGLGGLGGGGGLPAVP